MEIEIIEVMEVPAATPERLGKTDTWVHYKVDGTRFYQVTIPSEDATEETIEAAIREAEQKRAKLLGKKFEV